VIDLPTFPTIPKHHVRAYDKNKNGSLSYVEKLKWYSDYKRNDPKIVQLNYSHAQGQLTEANRKLLFQEKLIEGQKKAIKGYSSLKSKYAEAATALSKLEDDLARANNKVLNSSKKYDNVSEQLKLMEGRMKVLVGKHVRTVYDMKQLDKAYEELKAKSATSNTAFTNYRIRATENARKLETEIERLEGEIKSAGADITKLLQKIDEIEKNEEISLAQAVVDVRDHAFNTAFPNLGGISETQSRGFAFLAGLVLVGFMVGRIE